MPNYRGVPAAEKYAELLANGQERPRCACHQETMLWAKVASRSAGGEWRCVIQRREMSRLFRKNHPEVVAAKKLLYYAANPEKRREADLRYRVAHPEKIAASNARRIRIFGGTFRAPDMQFREYAVQLREERRRALKEASNG